MAWLKYETTPENDAIWLEEDVADIVVKICSLRGIEAYRITDGVRMSHEEFAICIQEIKRRFNQKILEQKQEKLRRKEENAKRARERLIETRQKSAEHKASMLRGPVFIPDPLRPANDLPPIQWNYKHFTNTQKGPDGIVRMQANGLNRISRIPILAKMSDEEQTIRIRSVVSQLQADLISDGAFGRRRRKNRTCAHSSKGIIGDIQYHGEMYYNGEW